MTNKTNDNLLKVWYTRPAADWQTEALAIGNGYMGCLVFGGTGKDKVHINEKTVWNGGPGEGLEYNYGIENPVDTEAALDKIRGDLNAIREKLDDKSQYVFGFAEDSYQACGTDTRGEAMDWLNRLMGSLKGFDAPEDYLNLYLCDKTVDENRVENYERALDLRTAVASVSYDFEGVHYRREYFTSHPANVLVIRLTADRKGKISFRAGLESCMSGTPDLSARENGSITLRNILPGNGLKTEAVLKVLPDGGELYTDGTTVSVSGADTATVILSCGTDYKMELPSFRGEDPTKR